MTPLNDSEHGLLKVFMGRGWAPILGEVAGAPEPEGWAFKSISATFRLCGLGQVA